MIWDVAAAAAGALLAFDRWIEATIVLALAVAAVSRMLFLADWDPARPLPASLSTTAAGRPPEAPLAQSLILLLLFALIHVLFFWGALDLAGVRGDTGPAIQAATIVVFVVRPRWLVAAARWAFPLCAAFVAAQPPIEEMPWDELAAVLVPLAFMWIVQRKAAPRLPSFGAWAGRRSDP